MRSHGGLRSAPSPGDVLTAAHAIFWDFDGVIKESVEMKGAAFEQLFADSAPQVARRIRLHHEANGGMSRFEKMPLYLKWAGRKVTVESIASSCRQYSELVRDAVVNAPWVPGSREFILGNDGRQIFVLLSATPQDELYQICEAIGLKKAFAAIHGSPTTKAGAMAHEIESRRLNPDQCVVIGDSDADYDAAASHGVPFLLRRTPFNAALQRRHQGLAVDDLTQAR